MTIEQVKEEAKKRFGKDLTDGQAQAFLDAHPAGELQDEELADVAGGGCGGSSGPEMYEIDLGVHNVCDVYEYQPNPKWPGVSRRCAVCKYVFEDTTAPYAYPYFLCTHPGGPRLKSRWD